MYLAAINNSKDWHSINIMDPDAKEIRWLRFDCLCYFVYFYNVKYLEYKSIFQDYYRIVGFFEVHKFREFRGC